MEETNNQVENNSVISQLTETNTKKNELGFIDSIVKKISDNKIYIYIGIAVLILGLVLYYFYTKNKKETAINKSDTTKPQEQFTIDSNGNPVKEFNKSVESFNSQMNNMPVLPLPKLVQELPLPKPIQELHMQQNKIKLEHPADSDTLDNYENSSSDNTSNNDDFEQIQSNENINIAQHNLTNSELEEINRKLEMMDSMNNLS